MLRSWLAGGFFAKDTMVWGEHLEQWRPMGALPDFTAENMESWAAEVAAQKEHEGQLKRKEEENLRRVEEERCDPCVALYNPCVTLYGPCVALFSCGGGEV